jgi:hypothetical protein
MLKDWQAPSVVSYGSFRDLTLQVGKQDPGVDLAQNVEGHCELNGGGAAGCIDGGGGEGSLL